MRICAETCVLRKTDCHKGFTMLLTFGSKYPRPEKRKVFNFDGVSAKDCSKIYVNGQI